MFTFIPGFKTRGFPVHFDKDKLIEADLLDSVTDIYRLKDHADKIATLEGMGEKSVTTMLKAIEQSKTRDMARFVNLTTQA